MLGQFRTVRSQWHVFPLLWLTVCAGFVSALISVGTDYYPTSLHGFPVIFFPGVVFGVVVSASCALGGYLHGLWKTISILVLSTAAYYASVIAAAGIQLSPFVLPQDGSISLFALAVGGLTGAFVVLPTLSLLLDSDIAWQTRLVTAMWWSPIGAVLAIVGWALGPLLGMLVWRVSYSLGLAAPGETFQNALQGETSHMYSLWVVWQTGVGFAAGLLLSDPKKLSRLWRT